jgi:hypothetical protein
MTSPNYIRYTSWFAYLSAAATLLQIVTGLLFVSIGGIFGPITDVAGVLQAVSMIALALVLHLILRNEAQGLSLTAVVIGIFSMLVFIVFQLLLVVGALTYEQVTYIVITAGGGMGIWLLLVNYLALRGKVFPRGLIRVGLIAGAGFLVQMVSFWIWELESPLFFIGSSVAYFGYLFWAIWLGRRSRTWSHE